MTGPQLTLMMMIIIMRRRRRRRGTAEANLVKRLS
jgi:hypothetical protein